MSDTPTRRVIPPCRLGKELIERLQLPDTLVVRSAELAVTGSDAVVVLTCAVTTDVALAIAAALEESSVATELQKGARRQP